MKKLVFTFFVLSGMICYSLKAQVLSVDFEDGTVAPFYDSDGAITVSSEEVHDGLFSMQIDGAWVEGTWGTSSSLIKPNTFYQYSFWVKTTDPGACKVDHLDTTAFALINGSLVKAAVSGSYVGIELNDYFEFTNEWQKIDFILFSGKLENEDASEAGNLVFGWSEGVSFFDDILIEEYTKADLLKIDFEDGSVAPFYTEEDNIATSSDEVHDGLFSMQIDGAWAEGTWGTSSNLLKANTLYHYSFWVKTSNPGAFKVDHLDTSAFAIINGQKVDAAMSGSYVGIEINPYYEFTDEWQLIDFYVYSGNLENEDAGEAGNLVFGWSEGVSYYDDILIEELTTSGTTGIKLQEVRKLEVYPNPAKERLYLDINANDQLSIYDIAGRKVIDQQLNYKCSSIEVGHLKSGIYFIELRSNGKIVSARFIIE